MTESMPAGMVSLEQISAGNLAIHGEMSFASVPDLWQQSQQVFAQMSNSGAKADAVNINLQALQGIDSAGLALLVAWCGWGHKHSMPVHFANPTQQLVSLAGANNVDELLGFTT